MHIRALLVSIPLLLPAACGGTEGSVPESEDAELVDTGPRKQTDCAAAEGLEFSVIDDFERGAATNAFTNNEVCARCSSLSGDELEVCREKCAQSQSPTDYDKPLPASIIPEGRCESIYAMHITSQQFREWGGLLAFPFSPAVDVREYDGISFWARIAWGTRSTVRGVVLDPETDSSYRDPDSGEALCEPESSLDDFDEACDPFGSYAVLTGDWQFVVLPFSEMRQRGFGHIAPFLDKGAARQVTIEYGAGAWDLWIDDVAFYRDAEGDK